MLNRSASLAMSTSVLKALPGKLDIKRHSPSILYMYIIQEAVDLVRYEALKDKCLLTHICVSHFKLKNHKAIKPAFNVGPTSAFKRRFASGPMMACL